MPIILIDSGTTHSRIRLVDKDSLDVLDSEKIKVGVRNSAIDGNNEQLRRKISQGIDTLLKSSHLTAKNIDYMVAAGMITSNLGIKEVPHVQAPAELENFVENSVLVQTEEFFNIPCLYVPGMKNAINDTREDDISLIDEYDIMRGEEVETYGLLKQLAPQGKGIMVLPGSHTKYVLVGEKETLLSCTSTLGGEMLSAIRDQTIISDSLNESLINEVKPGRLIEGFIAAEQHGITRALFHIRLLQLYSELSADERANYYTGIVLYYDIQILLDKLKSEADNKWIIVGGSNPLRYVFIELLRHVNPDCEVIEATNQQVEFAAVYGAHKIGESYYNLKRK